VSRVPYRSRRPATREGKRLQVQVERVADAVTTTRVALDASQRVTLGAVVLFPDDVPPPSGWLRCDGSTVPRQAHPALFQAIGEVYGAGDGATTFGLPDLSVWAPTDFAAWILAR
jgi:hypothetical protein